MSNLRLGGSEKALILYLAENPLQRNMDLAIGLEEDKSNITNRLKKLEEKGLIKRRNGSQSDKWSLSETGIGAAIDLGTNVISLVKKYRYIHEDFNYLLEVEKIYREEAGEIWLKNRDKLIGDSLKIRSLLVNYSERVRVATGVNLIVEWAETNLNKKIMNKIGERIKENPYLVSLSHTNSFYRDIIVCRKKN